ncbi:glycosyltransferase family 1 protein [Achromobacter sp. GG226]|uniref:glycosyltransferase n=1 Tax=Verticiella alkaliphila TaxID=2779529 RepID=UPI001C0E03D9|nr:glycosyltransferase [Verticiella sp. GG226]MBU4612517.1 glycosyltransferase family 1 protein [Verticiella sp. GG226]
MSRILFCVVPEKGHLNPCIGPAQHLRAAGMTAAFWAPADIRPQLAAAGGFDYVGPDRPTERHDISRGARFAEQIQDGPWLRQWIRTLLIEETPGQVDGLRAVIRDYRPDLVVVDPLLYAAAIAAALEGLPWVSLSNSLNPVLPDNLDSALLRTVRWLADERDALFARFGLTAQFRGCDVLSPHLTIALTTPALVGPPPDGVTLVGPALPSGARGDEPGFPWDRLDPALPLVYVSLGSQLYYQPELFARIDAALRDAPVQLVLSVGELADADALPELGPHVVAVRYAPQLALLARTQLFITHGGANSVMEALAMGVPMLVSPLCNDQFHSAHFVVAAGAGRGIDLLAADVPTLREAVLSALADSDLRAGAAAVQASYQRDGSAEAARLISRLAAESRPATAS